MDNQEVLNVFFVRSFNKVLGLEEAAMAASGGVSLAEAHTITAAAVLIQDDRNTISGIAHFLSLSLGAVSVSVNSLVKSGYLIRKASDEDRRKVFIFPTVKGKKIVSRHNQFHHEIINVITSRMTDDEITILAKSFISLGDFLDHAGDKYSKKKPVRKVAGYNGGNDV